MNCYKTAFVLLISLPFLSGCFFAEQFFVTKGQQHTDKVVDKKSMKLVSPNPDDIKQIFLILKFSGKESFAIADSLGFEYDVSNMHKTQGYSITDHTLISKFCATIEQIKEIDIDTSILWASPSVPQLNILFEKKEGTMLRDSELYCVALEPPVQVGKKNYLRVTIWRAGKTRSDLICHDIRVWMDSSDMEALWNALGVPIQTIFSGTQTPE